MAATGKAASVLAEVEQELSKSVANYGRMRSHHEAFAVIQEEVDEYWEGVKQRRDGDRAAMRKDLIQIAAMAIRAVIDVADKDEVYPG